MTRAVNKGYYILTQGDLCKFYKENILCAVANREGNMYYLQIRYKNSSANVTEVNDVNVWHEKLAHQNMQYVKTVLANNNIKVKNDSFEKCQACLEGKIHRLPFSTSDTKTTRTCELIHADTCGPMEEPSVGGSRYFLILKDDYSNYRSVYFIKSKDQVKKYIENFIRISENVTGNKIKYFRSDNGLEFVNNDLQKIFLEHGIVHQTTVPYSPEQNGKAERENRTLIEAARTMLCSKGLPKKLWAEAINTAAYVLNKTGKSNEEGKTPYETWTNKSFDINTLKIFGTPVFAHIPKEKRRKWDSKGEKGIMVGYDENVKGYRIYFSDKNDVKIKRDVVFIEEHQHNGAEKEVRICIPEQFREVPETGDSDHSQEDLETAEDNNDMLNVDESETTKDECSEYHPSTSDEDTSFSDAASPPLPVTRAQRQRKQPTYYSCNNVYFFNNVDFPESN